MEYALHILIMVSIYTILAVSLNWVAGCTGLLSIGHAAFYGIGAYTAALLGLRAGLDFPLSLVGAVLVSVLLGVVVGIPCLRVRDDYFAIATLAFQVITFALLNNLQSLTGGPLGLPRIPRPSFLGATLTTHQDYLLLTAWFVALVLWMNYRIVCSPFGRVLRALREDEILTQAMGKDVASYKLQVFTFGAGTAAVAGALYASYVTFIDPSSFTLMESIFIIAIVIIGGAGSLWGPVVGAIVLVTFPELLRFAGLPGPVAANLREIAYGGLLVALMVFRPQGLLGRYAFAAEDPEK